jgi:M6 family metalloprotease-like protein
VKHTRLFVALILAASLISAPAFATAKAGAKCTKAGATSTSAGKKFTCIKSGTKLVWNKGVAVKAAPKPSPNPVFNPVEPTPTATPTPTPTPSTLSVSDPVANCKIQDASNPYVGVYGGALHGGFINKEMPVPSSGTVTWYLVPLEFTDLKGEANWRSRVDQQMQLLSEYYEFVSYGKLNIKWKIHDNWVTMPGDQAKFEIKLSGDYITTENFWKEAISAADSKIDFTGVQVINFLLPKNQTVIKESAQGFPWTGDINKYNTSEGKLAAFTILGQFFEASQRNYWSYWAHEYGHTLGIPHISGSRSTSTYQTYDLMGNQDSRRELSGWSRFAVTKWLEDKWVYCKSKSNITSELVNLADLNSRGDGNKLVVIPLSTTKALLLESRNNTKFVGIDAVRGNTDGVLVYVYDATMGHNSEYLFPASSTSDPILSKGESVTYEGVNIKVVSVGTQDQILISLKP